MASVEELKRFSNFVDLRIPGLYVISPNLVKTSPIKIGYSKNLKRRLLKDYGNMWPWGFTVHMIACIANARDAESFLKTTLGRTTLKYGSEFYDSEHIDHILNEVCSAHQKYAGTDPIGQQLFTASNITIASKAY